MSQDKPDATQAAGSSRDAPARAARCTRRPARSRCSAIATSSSWWRPVGHRGGRDRGAHRRLSRHRDVVADDRSGSAEACQPGTGAGERCAPAAAWPRLCADHAGWRGGRRGVESKEGRLAIRAGITVDCTGDGDTFGRAGAGADTDIEERDIHHCMNTSWIWGGSDMTRWISFKTGDAAGFSAFMVPAHAKAAVPVRMLDRVFDRHVMGQMQAIVFDARRPEEARDAYGITQAREALDTIYAWLDHALAGRQWAAGDAFTLADAALHPRCSTPIGAPDRGSHHTQGLSRTPAPRPSFARCVDNARPYRRFFPLGAPDRDQCREDGCRFAIF